MDELTGSDWITPKGQVMDGIEGAPTLRMSSPGQPRGRVARVGAVVVALVAAAVVASLASTAPAAADRERGPLSSRAQFAISSTVRWGLEGGVVRPLDAVRLGELLGSPLDVVRGIPHVGGSTLAIVGDPRFMPDWDHDGRYGDSLDALGASSAELLTGYFPYPCERSDGLVFYQDSAGRCVPASIANSRGSRFGVARQVRLTNSRGIRLAATIWMPSTALRAAKCPGVGDPARTGCGSPRSLRPGVRLPTVVFSVGILTNQPLYHWIAMDLAAAGYVVVTYDPAGQGQSGGPATSILTGRSTNCVFAGACQDLQDVVRWAAGQSVGGKGAGRFPVPTIVDKGTLAVGGNSMGALATENYLWDLARGHGFDGRPLPRVKAAFPIAGGMRTAASAPTLFVTSDGDGSPALVPPGVLGLDSAYTLVGTGIGYHAMKAMWDRMQRDRAGANAVQMVVRAGGTHVDDATVAYFETSPWARWLVIHYATRWLDCHLSGVTRACIDASAPLAHLSRSFASEVDADGPHGRATSRCIVRPDRVNLNMTTQELLGIAVGHPVITCH